MKRVSELMEIHSHSYKCFMRACIGFSNALFHVFIGPLFANTASYAYLDLVIWAIAPLVFIFIRGPLINYFSEAETYIYHPTMKVLIACTVAMIPSYLFLNFSPSFRWNDYSETFNLDVGFFIFDFTIRTLEILVDLQPQKNHVEDDECRTYCKFQHALVSVAYWLVFVLSSTFDINKQNNKSAIFAWCSLFSFFTVILLPWIYHRVHSKSAPNYKSLEQEEDLQMMSEYFLAKKLSTQELWSKPQVIKKIIGLTLMTSSLLLNMNYFSLWMMEPMDTDGSSPASQFNITIQMVSCFFMGSSLGYYLASVVFQSQRGGLVARISLMFYGVMLCGGYWSYTVNYISVLILGFGFQQVCILEFEVYLSHISNIDSLQLALYNEVIVFAILPLLFLFLGVFQDDLSVYVLVSGMCLLVGAFLFS